MKTYLHAVYYNYVKTRLEKQTVKIPETQWKQIFIWGGGEEQNREKFKQIKWILPILYSNFKQQTKKKFSLFQCFQLT